MMGVSEVNCSVSNKSWDVGTYAEKFSNLDPDIGYSAPSSQQTIFYFSFIDFF